MAHLRHKKMGHSAIDGGWFGKVFPKLLLVLIIVILVWAQNNLLININYICEEANLPSSFTGYKITHISDLHNTNLNVKWVVEKADPDVIVVTGGFADDDGNVDNSIRILNQLSEIAPTYYIYNTDDEQGSVSQSKATDITNDSVELHNEGLSTEEFIKKNYGKGLITEADRGIDSSVNKLKELEDNYNESLNDTIILAGIPNDIDENNASTKVYSLIGNDSNKFTLALLGNFDLLNSITKTNLKGLFIGGTMGTDRKSDEFKKGIYDLNGTSLYITGGVGTFDNVDRIFNFPEVQTIVLSDGTLEIKTPLDKFFDRIFNTIEDSPESSTDDTSTSSSADENNKIPSKSSEIR